MVLRLIFEAGDTGGGGNASRNDEAVARQRE